jgi:hypothetical protein
MDRVDRLTCAEINDALRDMLDPDHFCVALQVPELTGRRKNTRAAAPQSGAQQMENGAIYLPNRDLPICDMTILLPGGHFFTPPEKAGVNALCAELLTSGSGKWSEEKIAEKLDALGADLTIAASANSFAIRANAPRGKFHQFIGFLAEVLAAPDFQDRAFERERRTMLAEEAAKVQKPAFASRSAVREMLYGDHPYANNVRLSQVLPTLTPEDARKFYRNLWMRDRAVFAFGGEAVGVRVSGAEYEAEGINLLPSFPLGVSNGFVGSDVSICLEDGVLLVIWEGAPEDAEFISAQ